MTIFSCFLTARKIYKLKARKKISMMQRGAVPESPIEKAKVYLERDLPGGFETAARTTITAAVIHELKKRGTHPAGIIVEYDDGRREARIYRDSKLMESVPYSELNGVLDSYWKDIMRR